MPRDHSAMVRGFAEKLIVPETYRPSEQLRRRHQESRVPKQVVKTWRDAPRAQGMKEHCFRIGGFIGMKFVKEVMARMIWIDQLHEFGAQRLNLIVIQDANAGEVAISVKELDLIVGEAIFIQNFVNARRFEESGDRFVML